jgi:uncharacterized protein
MRARFERSDRGSFVARRLAVGYAMLATLAAGIAIVVLGEIPWTHPSPWISLDPALSLTTSAVGGLTLAALIILATRFTVARYAWARRLHEDLRPVARDLSLSHILLIAGLSSLGEELLFRGLLTPWLGVVGSAVLFGLAHQMRGSSRLVWAAWAALVGLGLGALFAATGSLVGPLLCHAVVNAVNLSFLRAYTLEDKVSPLTK